MSAIGTIALVLACAWLGALSVLAALLVRQVALLSELVDPDYSLDGLTVGRRLPRVVADLLPDAGGKILVLGASCAPCQELVQDLRDPGVEQAVVAVIEGDATLAAALAEALPTGVRAVTGDEANDAYAALDLQTTPFLFSVDGRKIVHKAVLRGADHLDFLLQQADTEARPTTRSETQTLEAEHVG